MGSRDSELAVLVEDEERVPSRMNGEEYEAGPLALALRKECFRCVCFLKHSVMLFSCRPCLDTATEKAWQRDGSVWGGVCVEFSNLVPFLLVLCTHTHTHRPAVSLSDSCFNAVVQYRIHRA